MARFGGVGDDLIAASPFAALKRMGYMTEMIAGEGNHVVYLNNPYIDKLSVKNTDRDIPKGDLKAWQAWFDSRAREYDIFGHASHSCEGRHAFFQSMTAFWWDPEARRKVAAVSYLETVHDLVKVPYGPLFWPTPEEYAMAFQTKKQIGDRFVLWVLSGTRIDKVYPYSTMAIARIIKEVGAPVVLMGGPHEKEHSMATKIKDYVESVNSTRDGLFLAVPAQGGEKCWPLRTSLTFALVADLVVTPDTGTAWAVAFEPMPKVVMVSHASIENITKYWITMTLSADPTGYRAGPVTGPRRPDTCVVNKEATVQPAS
jgi:ADP-heptose:LPS heptosyltransferase